MNLNNITTYNQPLALIVNYDSLYKRSSARGIELNDVITEFIKSCKGENVALILDESHSVKDPTTNKTKAVDKIQKMLEAKSSLWTYLLTGTPFTTDYEDVWKQLKFLGCPMTKGEFREKFCILGNVRGLLGWQQPIIGYRNLDVLYQVIHLYAITIKSELVLDLPEQIFVYHEEPITNTFKLFTQMKPKNDLIQAELRKRKMKMPKEFEGTNPFYRNLDFPSRNFLADTPGSLYLRSRQASIGFIGNAEESTWYDRSRLNDLRNLLELNRDNYVIFYNYTPELLELYDLCEALKYNIDVYCGDIKSLTFYEKYESQSDAVRLNNKGNVILANFQSGSTGKNWQCYNKCIIFSLPVYRDWEQGLKRVHRLGQKDPVFYHVFYQNNWLDKKMMDSLTKKGDYTDKMFESDFNLHKEDNDETN